MQAFNATLNSEQGQNYLTIFTAKPSLIYGKKNTKTISAGKFWCQSNFSSCIATIFCIFVTMNVNYKNSDTLQLLNRENRKISNKQGAKK